MEQILFIAGILPLTFMIVAPILIAATGGMICERSGVVNIALEGLMSMGAMAAAITHVFLESETGFSIPLALVFASLAGGLFSLIHAFASVTLRANQLISGTGINLLSNGLTVFVCQLLFRMDRSMSFKMGMRPGMFGIYPTVWIALIILAAAWFILYKRPGLCLSKHPQALVSSGAIGIRYAAVFISGLLAGLAGGCIVLMQDTQFTANTISGKGFIALAAVYLGRRLPLGILGFSFLFGLLSSLAVNLVNLNSLRFLPPEAFSMTPYLITLLTLVIFSGKNHAPRAAGQVWD